MAQGLGFFLAKGKCWQHGNGKPECGEVAGKHSCQLWSEGKWGNLGPTAEAHSESMSQTSTSATQVQGRSTESPRPLLGPAVPSLTPAAHWLFLLRNVPAPRILLGNRGSSYPLSHLSYPICEWDIWGCPGPFGWKQYGHTHMLSQHTSLCIDLYLTHLQLIFWDTRTPVYTQNVQV